MIKNKILNNLLSKIEPKEIEKHLFFQYIVKKELEYRNCKILCQYFNDFQINIDVSHQIENLRIQDVKDLENHMELIIPAIDKKLNGAFFTPNYIIDFIIDELKPKESHKNVDPSCGCGAFLIGLTEYYKIKFNKAIKTIVKENIYGSDILWYNIERTKILLCLYALQNGEILEDSDFNLYHQDSLKANWVSNFDNVVGNPPYVKFQDLTKETREYLSNNWTTIENGSFNLYFAFFELGYKLLKPSGKLGYITPNNYFTSLSGLALRKFFHQKKCVFRIIDFTHKKVFDVQTYTAITFLSKDENNEILFDRINDDDNPNEFLQVLNSSVNYIKNLNANKWRLLKADEQFNIKTIESVGIPLGQLFEINAGIATLKDNVFFIDGTFNKNDYYFKETENGIFEIEKDVTKPVYKTSDFITQSQLEQNTRRIICPYKIKEESATPICEKEFLERYPKCYNYLLSEKERLENRDKAKIKFNPFYIWGRTQGLTKRGMRILTPTFSQSPRFLLINEEEAFFTNGYAILFKEYGFFANLNPITKKENIGVLQKILNSSLMKYYISKTSVSIDGGYKCYQKNFIEKFSIPTLSNQEIKIMDKINDLKEIDDFLFNKYQLNISKPNLFS